MTDATTIAERYLAVWNETDAERRRALITEAWTESCTYVDPLMRGEGPDAIEALVAGVQQRFPDFQFRLLGAANGFGNYVRFSWQLGPANADGPIQGTDFVELADGRIRRVTGFLDRVPDGA